MKAFCDVLGIERPIVYGASFGGMVALAYATRHPEHPGKLILVSTEAAGTSHPERRVALFEQLGGAEVGALARRRFLEGELDEDELEAWVRLVFPVYTRTRKDPLAAQRAIRRPEVNLWFARPGGEGRTFNFFPDLSRIQCPTLVLGGEDDPMIPIECQEDSIALGLVLLNMPRLSSRVVRRMHGDMAALVGKDVELPPGCPCWCEDCAGCQ